MSLNILDRKIPEAIKYASNIITETSDFIPYCKSVYMMLVNSPEFSSIVFNYENLKKIISQVILNLNIMLLFPNSEKSVNIQ